MSARAKRDWAPAFLEALGELGMVTHAAARAGVHRDTAYKRRDKDEAFAQAWSDVEERSTEELERVAVQRATDGSDVLLIFLLKSRRPERYRDHHRVEHTGPAGGRLGVEFRLDEGAREAIAGVLRQRPAAPPESSS